MGCTPTSFTLSLVVNPNPSKANGKPIYSLSFDAYPPQQVFAGKGFLVFPSGRRDLWPIFRTWLPSVPINNRSQQGARTNTKRDSRKKREAEQRRDNAVGLRGSVRARGKREDNCHVGRGENVESVQYVGESRKRVGQRIALR